METYNYIVLVIFIFWFLVTIIVQFQETVLAKKIKHYDYFSLIPLWTFFAPNPGVNDYHLLYRDKRESGDHSNWEEVAINENRKWVTCFWNPNKRGKKVLNDVIQNLISVQGDYKQNPRLVMFSLPYMLILNTIMKEPQLHHDSDKKQFLLSASDGYEQGNNPQFILLSEFHPI